MLFLRSSFINNNRQPLFLPRNETQLEKDRTKNGKIDTITSLQKTCNMKCKIILEKLPWKNFAHAWCWSAETGKRRRTARVAVQYFPVGIDRCPLRWGVSHPPPISTAYRGIMSVTSVRLPDSFHIVRPRSPSVPLSIEVGLRQPSVSKRKCSFNASSFVRLHLSIRGGSFVRRNVPDRSFRSGAAVEEPCFQWGGGSKWRNRVTPGNLFIGEAR